MFRILLLGIFGGGMLAYFGVQECRVGWGTSSQPESVSLAELEAGKRPANNHLLIQEHLAVFPKRFTATHVANMSRDRPAQIAP